MTKKKLSIHDFYKMKECSEKITWLTSYDFPKAQFAEADGMDMILVGDSLRMCVYGYKSTVAEIITSPMREYCKDVRSGRFPSGEHCYQMIASEEEKFKKLVGA